MNRFRSLNFSLVVLVFVIMIFSSILSGLILFILIRCDFLSYIRVTPRLFLMIGLIVSTIIGTILTFPIGKHFLRPLNQLIEATQEVAKGNFNVKVKELKKNYEIDKLIRSFNIMTNELSSIEMFRKDFINNFSHEFRTPIVSIRGFARQLKNSTLTDEMRKEYIDIIIRESERLTNMSSNILLLTKLENQEIVTDKKLFSLDEQIRNCILLLQMEWERKDISFNIELDSVEYYGNEEMLSHVWLNLLGNAIKFSHNGGEIKVKCCNEGNYIKIKISDNGIGMNDDTRHQVFEKFYQGDSSRSSEGNGLGLSLVKRTVDLCEGKINVKSRLGKGTDIAIRLPN
ncbi:HAMP domain-containing histidine kinase [Tissierella pigra]|uniref:Heme sensor protein HssS n=1 Tax=Tissierella pigra TaxID=2607614 RepID=A0A6N7XVD9_9FIRM|nr:HAMP domain-containing sensor histidine kinase [Tissierella pigra]MBU5425384.1 HAMP domain-containing histidine kinase [Tissierella pigra]MSU00504.1 HAMP domain-containing histidine kinase [Tissierella pigra]